MQKISSLALAFAFVMPLAGCPAGDDTGTDTMAETSTTPTSSTTEADTDTPATDTMAATDSADTGMTTGETTTTGGAGGYCDLACTAPADCAAGGDETPWSCEEGFCVYTPPACDDTNCPSAAGAACADVDGVNQCTFPCPNGNECDALGLVCEGMDDAGNAICTVGATDPCGGAAEGEPCNFGGADQYGVCTDGECSCADDTECTAAGFACHS